MAEPQNKCSVDSEIAGCVFSLHPMSDQFVDLILGALKEVDTSKVWRETDDVSTTVRGKPIHVFDVVAAMFLRVAESGTHTVLNAMWSIGCPGDTEGDAWMDVDDEPANRNRTEQSRQVAGAKFALYPMSGEGYMDVIYRQIEAMKAAGVEVSPVHYCTRLDGEAKDIFRGLEGVFQATAEEASPHTVMTLTMSANSPGAKKEG